MKPYYEDDSVTIYHADALQTLRELDVSVHAVIMDPPYSSGARTEAAKPSSGSMLRGVRWAQKPIENDQMTTPGFIWLMREICFALKPLLCDGAAVLSFIDWRQWATLVGAVESTNLRVNNMLIWDKESIGLGAGFRTQHELILHASLGTQRMVDRSIPNILRHRRDDNSSHPSPKPETLIGQLLTAVTDKDEIVIDPFMGCGPTLRAAKNLGRKAIGIEIEERYCDIAARRMSQLAMQL